MLLLFLSPTTCDILMSCSLFSFFLYASSLPTASSIPPFFFFCLFPPLLLSIEVRSFQPSLHFPFLFSHSTLHLTPRVPVPRRPRTCFHYFETAMVPLPSPPPPLIQSRSELRLRNFLCFPLYCQLKTDAEQGRPKLTSRFF